VELLILICYAQFLGTVVQVMILNSLNNTATCVVIDPSEELKLDRLPNDLFLLISSYSNLFERGRLTRVDKRRYELIRQKYPSLYPSQDTRSDVKHLKWVQDWCAYRFLENAYDQNMFPRLVGGYLRDRKRRRVASDIDVRFDKLISRKHLLRLFSDEPTISDVCSRVKRSYTIGGLECTNVQFVCEDVRISFDVCVASGSVKRCKSRYDFRANALSLKRYRVSSIPDFSDFRRLVCSRSWNGLAADDGYLYTCDAQYFFPHLDACDHTIDHDIAERLMMCPYPVTQLQCCGLYCFIQQSNGPSHMCQHNVVGCVYGRGDVTGLCPCTVSQLKRRCHHFVEKGWKLGLVCKTEEDTYEQVKNVDVNRILWPNPQTGALDCGCRKGYVYKRDRLFCMEDLARMRITDDEFLEFKQLREEVKHDVADDDDDDDDVYDDYDEGAYEPINISIYI
jgi:hypothetical protein